jgi:hypothetical protein
MNIALENPPISASGLDFETKFSVVRQAAEKFESLDKKSTASLYEALAQIFDFGEEICQEPGAFARFLTAHDFKFGKVTRAKPYKALVDLAFSDDRGKTWRSEMGTVLTYAAEMKDRVPIRTWLQKETISDWYDIAVKHNSRLDKTRNQKLRSAQLETITRDLEAARIIPEALSGLTLPPGFHRSLIFSDKGQSYLVHIDADEKPDAIEKYLLALASKKMPTAHPLSGRTLYRLFRAVDLIAGTCFTPNEKSIQLIAVWNESSEEGSVTKLRYISDVRSFTNATVTLMEGIPELEGLGQFAFEIEDAQNFRRLFQHSFDWKVVANAVGVSLIDDAPSPSEITLFPISRYFTNDLRQGGILGRKTRHFRATCEGMKAASHNLEMAQSFVDEQGSKPAAPKRLQWLARGSSIVPGFENDPGYSKLSYDFLEFATPAPAIDEQMELLLADMDALWKVASPYGEDLTGFLADIGVVDDAAICIDHEFTDGDRFEYISPMVLGVSMSRTQVCEGLAAIASAGPLQSAA